jgi:hypothetical protein
VNRCAPAGIWRPLGFFAVLRGEERAAPLRGAVHARPRADVPLAREREDAVARERPVWEVRRPFAEAPCFVFLGAITSESCGQASDH